MDFRFALYDAWHYVQSPTTILRHVVWDIFLGLVAVLLAQMAVARHPSISKRREIQWLLWALWLAFLPNTAYLMTTVRSIPDVIGSIFMASVHNEIDGARRTAASLMWVFFYLTVATIGAVLYGAAVQPFQQQYEAAGRRARIAICWLISFVAALGTDLGLSHRFNSWDLVLRPGEVITTTVDLVIHPNVETIFVVALTLILAVIWMLTGLIAAGWSTLSRSQEIVSKSPANDDLQDGMAADTALAGDAEPA